MPLIVFVSHCFYNWFPECFVGCERCVVAPESTDGVAERQKDLTRECESSQTSTHCTLCWKGPYEVSPELLDRGLPDVAVGSMLEASYVFGPEFDVITELHTDLLLHTP